MPWIASVSHCTWMSASAQQITLQKTPLQYHHDSADWLGLRLESPCWLSLDIVHWIHSAPQCPLSKLSTSISLPSSPNSASTQIAWWGLLAFLAIISSLPILLLLTYQSMSLAEGVATGAARTGCPTSSMNSTGWISSPSLGG